MSGGLASIWWLRLAEGFILVVGAAIAYASLRAFRRNRDPGLALLGVGFAVVTVAAALAGVLYELTTHDLLTAWTVSAGFDCVGFTLILVSIARPRSPARIEAADGEPPADRFPRDRPG